MLESDKLKLHILDLLKKHKEMSIGDLKRKTGAGHHYTVTNALEFLEHIKLISITEKKDNLSSKVVRLRK